MKQKLPGKGYGNLDSIETQETSILWNSWTRYSLLRLLVATLFNKKHFINSFDFRIVTLLLPRSYKNRKYFIFNTVLLFTLPISMYRLDGKNIVEREDSDLTVRGRIRHGKDSTGVCKKSFRDLNTNFDTFLHNFFSREKKLRKNCFSDLDLDSVGNYRTKNVILDLEYYNSSIVKGIVPNYKIFRKTRIGSEKRDINNLKYFSGYHRVIQFLDSIFFDRFTKSLNRNENLPNTSSLSWFLSKADDLYEQKEYDSNPNPELDSSEVISNPYSLRRRITNCPGWEVKILQNLQNWGESDEILVRSSSLLEGYYNLPNYMGFNLQRFFKKNYLCNSGRSQRQTENTSKYFHLSDGINLFITLEDILSDSIYRLSKYVSREARGSNSRTMGGVILSNEESHGNIDHPIDTNYAEEKVHKYKKDKSTSFVSSDELPYLHKYGVSKRIENNSLDTSFANSIHPMNQFFFSPGKEPYLNEGGIHNIPESLCYLNLFSIDTVLDESLGGIFQSMGGISKTGSNYIGDLWEIQNYFLRFLSYSLSFSPAYNKIRQNNLMDRKILYVFCRLFLGIFRFRIPLIYSKFRISTNCTKSDKLLAKNDNELNILINRSNKIRDSGLLSLLPNWNGGDRNIGSINYYTLIESKTIICNSESIINLIQIKFMSFYNLVWNSCNKYFNELLNNLYSKGGILDPRRGYNSVTNEYSTAWRRFVERSYIRNIDDVARNELILQVYKWVDQINNSKIFYYSKNLYYNLPIVMNISGISFSSRNTKKLSDYISNFVDINGISFVQNKLFKKLQRFINLIVTNRGSSSITSINGTNKRFPVNLSNGSIFPTKVSFDFAGNRESFPDSNYGTNSSNSVNMRNLQSNYNEHSRGVSTKNAIYSKFIMNSSRRIKKFPIIAEILEDKIAQSQLLNALLLEISHRLESNLLLFHNLTIKSSNCKNFYSSNATIFSKRKTNRIGTIFYYRSVPEENNSFGEIHSEKGSVSVSINTEVEDYCNMLRSESLRSSKRGSNRIFQSINVISLYSEPGYPGGSKHELGSLVSESYNQSRIFGILMKRASFKNYTSWFFTLEWWEYHTYTFVEIFRGILPVIHYHFEYIINESILKVENFKKLWRGILSSKWDSCLFTDSEEKVVPNFVWSDPRLINNWNSLQWAAPILVASTFIFHRNSFSTLIGSDCIDSWESFETIKYSTDASRAFRFTKLMYRSKTQPNKTENIIIHFFKNLSHHTGNIKFYLLTKNKLKEWLISNKSLDLSRRKRNLLIQSLITHTRLKGYGFQFYPKHKPLNNGFGYQVTHQQGLLYLQYLAEILKKELINHSLHLADKWIFFASLQRIILSRTLWQAHKFDSGFRKIPIPFQFGLSCSKGILLIGPAEIGRSYLIKNLAKESYVPLLRVSINKLLYNKPDVVTENWMNILIESLRRLNLTLNLAKKMSPCIIWIQNIHQLDVNRLTQNVESDPTFLLGILLKHFQSDRMETKNNIIMIGSTHAPEKVDPALISPNRLDRIINIRLFHNYQRRNQFSVLLNDKGFRLGNNASYSNEFGSRTMGYNVRDLATFTNEILLINVARNESLIYTDAMRLAFHRQVFGSTHNKPNIHLEVLLYRVGRAVAQNILIEGSATNPLSINNYLCKRKFYYLSKWYLEPPIDGSIVKESVILTHVLGCLAGAAARDSWFMPEKYSDSLTPLDKSVENDFDLASSILESLFMEFSRLETCETGFVNYEKKGVVMFPTKNYLSIMQNGTFILSNRSVIYTHSRYKSSISQQIKLSRRNHKSQSTTWSPRSWRLSFLRNNSFDCIKRPNDFEFSYNFESSRRKDLPNFFFGKKLMDKGEDQLLYERILPRVRRRNVQELESQFEQILLEEQSEILGFFRLSTQYRMEYQLNNELGLFIGKRILWDPIGLLFQIRHFVFPRRDFFVDEEMLRRLYVTYGARRERERSRSTHKIKQFFLRRGYNKDLISRLSVRWWNQLPTDGKQSISTLRQIEAIGIQLKRPRIFTPVYLYQRWLIENLPEKFSRFELITYRQRWFKITNPLLNDSFTHTTLLESYQYLSRFFLSNEVLLNQMIQILLKRGWLFQNEIEDLIRNTK